MWICQLTDLKHSQWHSRAQYSRQYSPFLSWCAGASISVVTSLGTPISPWHCFFFPNNQCFHNKSPSAASPDGWFSPTTPGAGGGSPLGLLQLCFQIILHFLPILLGLGSFDAVLQSLLIPRSHSAHVPLGALVSLSLHPDNITSPRSSFRRSLMDPSFIFRAQCCEPRCGFNSQSCEPNVLLRRRSWVFRSSGEDLIRALCWGTSTRTACSPDRIL